MTKQSPEPMSAGEKHTEGRTIELTYAERYLLGSLAQFGARHDYDAIPERVLVNTGLTSRSTAGSAS